MGSSRNWLPRPLMICAPWLTTYHPSGRLPTMRTKWAHRAGTMTYRLNIFVKTPCEGLGNMGLEGFDEEYYGGEVYSTEEKAKKAVAALTAETLAKLGPDAEVMHAEIVQTRWDADVIEDREYGVIQDATQTDLFRRYGYPSGSRWRWDTDRTVIEPW